MAHFRSILAALLLLSLPALADPPTAPIDALTPGALSPDVTQETIGSTICMPGWTKTVRPPVAVTNRWKRELMPLYGYAPDTDPRSLELDHRIPIEAGGAPADRANTWPEPWTGPLGARLKDALETAVKRDICTGRLTLEQGRAIFLGDWRAAYEARFGEAANHP